MLPIETLRTELPGWTLAFSDLGGEVMGFCDLERQTIWVDLSLNERERRTTLMHEIVHALRGHSTDDPDLERLARIETALRLIPRVALLSAFNPPYHPEDVADVLNVDLDVLRCRLQHLSEDERHTLRRRLVASIAGEDGPTGDPRQCALGRWWDLHELGDDNPCLCGQRAPRFPMLRAVASSRAGQAAAAAASTAAMLSESHVRAAVVQVVTSLTS